MSVWPQTGDWTERIVTIFTTFPAGAEWTEIAVVAFLLLSWLYLIFAVRTMKRRTKRLETDVHEAIERIGGTGMEQQGELLRRIGWAVTYLERIDQKLEHSAPGSMRVASITAENLVVREHDDGRSRGGNGR
jgi:hypothetical protein